MTGFAMKKKVFVSYASKDKWVREWLVPQLEACGVEVLADYKTFHTGKASLVNIEESIEAADYTFFVLSKQWFDSEWTTLENYIVQTLSPANRDMTYFFLRLDEHPLPLRIKPFTYLDMTDAAMQEAQLKRLLSQLGIAWAQHTTIGPKSEHISLDRLPDTSGLLFGRESQLALLDAAWENPKMNVVAFVAQGGEGKTALCRNWVNTLAGQQFRGAERVYAWSFYSQGTAEDRQASSGMFIADALTWWGDAALANSPAPSVEKARRLAALIQQSRTLLILDGVEPLQYPPGEPHNGKIRDEALRILLKELASHNNGLCLVSTRVPIRELDSFGSSGLVLQERLPHLDKKAGADLLTALKVKGTPKDLEATAEEYHGHALALTLLGNLLREYCAGDIRRRDTIPPLQEEDQWGGHARRVLVAYARLFEQMPELEILRILGLFDRPAEPVAVAALLQGEMIPGITAQLAKLGPFEFKKACLHLRKLGILEDEERLDCHPLVREYFAGELQSGHADAWTEAHRRLYEHYKSSARELPDTLDEMEPLFRAMGHGCKAGLYQEALSEVYWKRIGRGDEGYSIKKLGGFSEDLTAIAGLFERPWEQTVRGLRVGSRSFLLNSAGFCLRGLGRLQEAVRPMAVGLEMDIERQDWKNAAIAAGNLSQLRLTIGELGLAVTDGRKAVALADQSGDEFQRMIKRATLADALQQAGEGPEAEVLFREAESLQKLLQPTYPRLYSLRGYQFFMLLLAQGEWEEVKDRATEALGWGLLEKNLLDISLMQLSMGRAAHLQAVAEGAGDFGIAQSWLDKAAEGIRKAGAVHNLPLGLLARAALLRDRGAYPAAETDLLEVEEIAGSGEMRLHLCDYHLEMARLCLAVGGRAGEAEGHYQAARRLVEETGYHLRDGELAELRGALGLG